jgi:hypothetical protein
MGLNTVTNSRLLFNDVRTVYRTGSISVSSTSLEILMWINLGWLGKGANKLNIFHDWIRVEYFRLLQGASRH